MDYRRHYNLLITRGQNRILDVYVECHHIVPRCMGGTDDIGNLVKLTPEEHYVAHQLLVKIYPGISGLIYAVRMMCFGNRRNNKMYGWIKREFSEERTKFRHSDETKKQMCISRGRDGRRFGKHSDDTKLKISMAVTAGVTEEKRQKHSDFMTGRTLTQEHKNKIREKSKLRTNSEETRKKISISNKGKIMSEESKVKMSLVRKGKSQDLTTCPICEKTGGKSNMTRYHFNNCKTREQI